MEDNTGLASTNYHPGCKCKGYKAHSTYTKKFYGESYANKEAREGGNDCVVTQTYNVG